VCGDERGFKKSWDICKTFVALWAHIRAENGGKYTCENLRISRDHVARNTFTAKALGRPFSFVTLGTTANWSGSSENASLSVRIVTLSPEAAAIPKDYSVVQRE